MWQHNTTSGCYLNEFGWGEHSLVGHSGGRHYNRGIVLLLQSLIKHLHVEETQEAQPAGRTGNTFGLKGFEGSSTGQLQLLQSDFNPICLNHNKTALFCLIKMTVETLCCLVSYRLSGSLCNFFIYITIVNQQSLPNSLICFWDSRGPTEYFQKKIVTG